MLKKLAGIPSPWKYIGLGVVVLILVGVILFNVRGIRNDERNEDNGFVEIGKTIERDRGNQEVIKRVEESRDAVDNPTSNELNVVCEKYDRNC